MDSMRHAAVLDIGKTNAKLVLVDMVAFREIRSVSMPNAVLTGGPYRHFDSAAIWRFVLAGLKQFQLSCDIDGISVTSHGAAAALVDADGALVLPVLDYEDMGPQEIASGYDQMRPDFAVTGSPRLPGGLNLGAQLFWLAKKFPQEWSRVAAILTLPQYWAFRLCGVQASEVTSLGTHTDLWEPKDHRFSALATRMGWENLFPPVRPASARLHSVTAAVASATGLKPETGVWCGIHDSNASLLPHVLNHERPLTVVSTGTWVIIMALDGALVPLDPGKDTLLNVDALGDPVPSARFMGGREFSVLTEGRKSGYSKGELAQVITGGIRVDRDAGAEPFRWSVDPASLSDGACFAVVSLYLAREVARRLDWIGARGPLIVEGPFAANTLFLDALAILAGRPVRTSAGNATGTSVGAALLIQRPDQVGQTQEHRVAAFIGGLAHELRASQSPGT